MSAQVACSTASHFDVEVIADVEDWDALGNEWDRVLRATSGYTPLQSFDFLATWWQCMARESRLWILVFRDGAARITGIAPLQIVTRRILGKSYRVLEFLAMTEDILVPTMLFPREDTQRLHDALIDFLARNRAEWDLIELDELAAGDPLLAKLKELAQRCNLSHRELPFHQCPYLDLSAHTLTSFRATRSRKLFKNLRASERKLNALAPTRVVTYRTPEDIDEGLRLFFQVERLSWKHSDRVGMSSDERYRTFYDRLLHVFARKHHARVLVLQCGDRPIAATMSIMFDRIYCSLQIVHDEQYARFSPGTLLELHEMEDLLQTGIAQRYEFLGGALTNKLRWTDSVVTTRCTRTRKRDARTRLLNFYEFGAKPAAKHVLRKLGYFKPPQSAPQAST